MDNQSILEELYRAKNLVVGLAKQIDVKNEKLLEMEFKLDEASEALDKLKAENRRLYQAYVEEQKERRLASESNEKLLLKFESLKDDLEMKMKRLDKSQSSVESDNDLIVQLDNWIKELDEKVDEMQDIVSLNQTLIVKERMSNLELQHARKELINELQDFWNSQTNIGIKRMGEVDPEPIRDACMKKFSGDWEMISTELCSLWQDLVMNPEWYPFKRELTDGKYQEIIDYDDVRLKELRNEWGDEVCKAVSDALLELNEFNGSGRYVVLELWNFKEGRKASLKDAVGCIIRELKTQKSHKRRRCNFDSNQTRKYKL